MKNEFYNICKKNSIYLIFGFFILLNIFCFPDLLNNRDIKINDESWVIQQDNNNLSYQNTDIIPVYIIII
jgi:hypothetical protein